MTAQQGARKLVPSAGYSSQKRTVRVIIVGVGGEDCPTSFTVLVVGISTADTVYVIAAEMDTRVFARLSVVLG